ncbi:MAG TPA: archaetidylserine decarboxylase [Fibrobacteria bacterium]|nr:archaetidylserine decarboxylase [Fibrobacteria bacterium]
MIILLKLLPRVFLSRLFGRVSRVRKPRLLARASIRLFHAGFPRIDLAEAKRTRRSDYESLQDFFTREIRIDARTVADSLLVSPCDGVFGQSGEIRQGTILQAKGIPYSVADFLQDRELAASLEGGAFCTIYLAPWNYHRVHHAIGGEIVQARHVPGDLWPVNKGAVEGIPGVFAKNERSSVSVRTPHGTAVAVMVGAYNVGSIRLAADKDLGHGTTGTWIPQGGSLAVAKADQLGVFELGSTVVLLLDKDLRAACAGDAFPEPGRSVRMGEAISFRA